MTDHDANTKPDEIDEIEVELTTNNVTAANIPSKLKKITKS